MSINGIYLDINLEQLVGKAIDVHCHGVGRFDFTEIHDIKLQEIEELLRVRNSKAILTLYLPKQNFDDFMIFMDNFAHGQQTGKYQNIVGIALEGPLLASHGGTPQQGVWNPSKFDWRKIASCGKKGLVYVIFSPDAQLNGNEINEELPPASVAWIAKMLLDKGVLPAAGHFKKDNPEASAKLLQSIYDVVSEWGVGPTLSDHLFNDMPHNFRHAWRTKEDRQKREQELHAQNIDSWSLDNIEEKLGPVPATMIKNAKKGLVKIAMNFDGEHVDLAIAKRTVELVGAENMLMMTDSIESNRLAGRDLKVREDNTLLYQDEGIVAAGSQGIIKQIKNMVAMGLELRQIEQITSTSPTMILKTHQKALHVESSYI